MREASELASAFRAVRARTAALCAPLSVEDHQVQPMADASPARWHLAHTTWFFEAFVLDGPRFDDAFEFLFNSYYDAVGPRVERSRRGLVTRPGLERIHAYREAVERRVLAALAEDRLDGAARARLELGLHHEQQHQELILTDAKYLLGTQPFWPAYRTDLAAPVDGRDGRDGRDGGAGAAPAATATAWRALDGGVVRVGAADDGGFAFDNERPAHDVIVRSFALATAPLRNREVQGFLADDGYREPRLWLADGWHAVTAGGWTAPLYWLDGERQYTLGGVRAVDPDATAAHLSYYEADAIARWLGARLPTEVEWELAARAAAPDDGDFADDDRLHPGRDPRPFGGVWEWTASSYAPYPGFRPLAGALGEYNGKFMSGQQVLRGGSCLTPRGHVRATYRNFFPPGARWQMSGARLARDA
ncbi:MAG: ergothioneine biosynthesis protein EgtB [Myxococcales bacterium]|nr:ergothioneine biosynthesis protein EgtB [Myxococcales bacterium]